MFPPCAACRFLLTLLMSNATPTAVSLQARGRRARRAQQRLLLPRVVLFQARDASASPSLE